MVAYGAGDAAIAVLEGVNGHKPQMGQSCPKYKILPAFHAILVVQPGPEAIKLLCKALCPGGHEMHPFSAAVPGNDTHGSRLWCAEGACDNVLPARAKKLRVPGILPSPL